MLAISVASTALQVRNQQQQAKQQEAAVNDGLSREYSNVQRMYDEQSSVAMDEMGERARQNLIELGHLHALQADSGLSGASPDRVEGEIQNLAQKDIVTIQQNSQRKQQQTAAQGQGSASSASSMLGNVQHANYVGAGLQIAGNAYSAYSGYQKDQQDKALLAELKKRGP